jgi:hypothetical protein
MPGMKNRHVVGKNVRVAASESSTPPGDDTTTTYSVEQEDCLTSLSWAPSAIDIQWLSLQ